METTNDNKPSNNYKILASTKDEKDLIIKAVQRLSFVQLILGPETIFNEYVTIHVTEPIDLFYLGQFVSVLKIQE
jgi:hypothetical protein